MKVYQTYCNSDTTEGRGPMVPSLCFLHKHDADRFVDGQPGIMGRTAQWSLQEYGDWTVKEVEVLESYMEIEPHRKRTILKGILERLSQEEIEVLKKSGFKNEN